MNSSFISFLPPVISNIIIDYHDKFEGQDKYSNVLLEFQALQYETGDNPNMGFAMLCTLEEDDYNSWCFQYKEYLK